MITRTRRCTKQIEQCFLILEVSWSKTIRLLHSKKTLYPPPITQLPPKGFYMPYFLGVLTARTCHIQQSLLHFNQRYHSHPTFPVALAHKIHALSNEPMSSQTIIPSPHNMSPPGKARQSSRKTFRKAYVSRREITLGKPKSSTRAYMSRTMYAGFPRSFSRPPKKKHYL